MEKPSERFQKAQEKLHEAGDELCKPHEDVVAFVVCKNSVSAIENYLKGYLNTRGFETSDQESLEHLLNRCRMLDKRFNTVDIQAIDCKSKVGHNDYCDSVEKVSSCYYAADELDTFLRRIDAI